MGLTINTPTMGFLAPPLVQTNLLTADAMLEENRLYIVNPTAPISLTLPTEALADGDSLVVKNVSTPNVLVTIANARIEGVDRPIELSDNTPVRLVWTTIITNNESYGWAVI